MLLARSGPRTNKEFKSLVFDEDYSYLFGLYE